MAESQTEKKMVYLEDGQSAHQLAKVGEQYLVRPIFEEEGREEPWGWWGEGALQLVDTVFDKAPVEAYDEELQAKKELIGAAWEELRAIKQEVHDSRAELEGLHVQLEQIPALEHLRDFVKGEITHVVYWSHRGLAIAGINSLAKKDGESSYFGIHPFPILTLMSVPGADRRKTPVLKRKLEWRLDRAWSRNGESMHPCKSKEHAEEVARGLILKVWESGVEYDWAKAATAAPGLGVKVPKKISDFLAASKKRTARKVFDEAEKKFTEATAALAAAPAP